MSSSEEQLREARYERSWVRVDLKITVFGPKEVQVILAKEELADWVETLVSNLFSSKIYKASVSSHTIVEKVNTTSTALSINFSDTVFKESIEQDGLYSSSSRRKG